MRRTASIFMLALIAGLFALAVLFMPHPAHSQPPPLNGHTRSLDTLQRATVEAIALRDQLTLVGTACPDHQIVALTNFQATWRGVGITAIRWLRVVWQDRSDATREAILHFVEAIGTLAELEQQASLWLAHPGHRCATRSAGLWHPTRQPQPMLGGRLHSG